MGHFAYDTYDLAPILHGQGAQGDHKYIGLVLVHGFMGTTGDLKRDKKIDIRSAKKLTNSYYIEYRCGFRSAHLLGVCGT